MDIGDGRQIKIKFTQPLIGDVSGLKTPVAYKQSKIDLSGAKYSSLNNNGSSVEAKFAFDGNISTAWQGKTAVNWIKTEFPEPKKVTGLRLYLGSYYIKTFTISGSNDDESWTQIGGTFTAASSTTSKWYEFTFENTENYLYYKLDTLTTYSSYVNIYELEWMETVPAGNETKFSVSFDEYNYIPGGTLSRKTRKVESFEENKTLSTKVDLSSGNFSNTQFTGSFVSLGFKLEDEEDG